MKCNVIEQKDGRPSWKYGRPAEDIETRPKAAKIRQAQNMLLLSLETREDDACIKPTPDKADGNSDST